MSNNNNEQRLNILPHPAKTNDPADLQNDQQGGGLRHDPMMGTFNVPGPLKMSKEMEEGLPPIATKEELQARQMALNQNPKK